MELPAACSACPRSGFTLIELSIVLVIIGLIIGGVLVGQDLINAARIRAQITQIEKFNQAVHTFQVKYNALPGDMVESMALAFGFTDRTQQADGFVDGNGDGNGILEGGRLGSDAAAGENRMFWVDLTTANLISGAFTSPDCTDAQGLCGIASTQTQIAGILPRAIIGQDNFITVYSMNGNNFYQLILATNIGGGGIISSAEGMTPQQSYQLDTKLDDGLPTTGVVISASAAYPAFDGTPPGPGPGSVGTATAGACGNTDTTPSSYNLTPLFANRRTCSISIQFQ